MEDLIPCVIDIDECNTNNGGCNQTCTNNVGSFFCSCQPGYQLYANNQSCNGKQDLNLKIKLFHLHVLQTSMNATLTMEAAIKHAQTISEVTSAHVCLVLRWMQITKHAVVSCIEFVNGRFPFSCPADINECNTINGGCNQTCTNNFGSYFCSCLSGFTLDVNK